MKKIFSILMIGLLLACASLISCSNGSDSGSGGNSGGGNSNSKYYGEWKYTDNLGDYILNILTDTDCQVTLPEAMDPFQLPYQATYTIAGTDFELTGNYSGTPVTITGEFLSDTKLHTFEYDVGQLHFNAADFIKQ